MLKKLLKYDMREMLRKSYPLYILSGALALLCCGMLFFVKAFEASGEYMVGVSASMSFYGFGLLGIFALLIMSLYAPLVRYYKSFFSREGYLYMVIPQKMSTLLLAKLISTAIWAIISILVATLAFLLAVAAPNLLYDPRGFEATVGMVLDRVSALGAELTVPSVIVALIHGIITVAEVSSVMFLAITLGSMLFRRRRSLGVVLFYLLLTAVKSLLLGAVETLLLLSLGAGPLLYLLDIIAATTVTLISAAAAFFITLHLLKTRYNLA